METFLFYLSLFVLLAGCGALQALSALKARRRRFLLPALTALPVLICVGAYVASDGWNSLVWLFLFLWSAAALLGTLLGALVGLFLRRRSQKHTP